MTKKELYDFAQKCIVEFTDKKEDIIDIYHLALFEIEEGGSENHECEIAYYDILELLNDQDTED